MSSSVLSPEDGAKLERLYAELVIADRRVEVILSTEGMTSRAFQEADTVSGDIRRRIREVLGTVL